MMIKNSYHCIGVMSGTSLDGLDLADLVFSVHQDKWSYSINVAQTYSYNDYWLEKLKNAIGFSNVELQQLNEEYTEYLANKIKEFIQFYNIKNLDAICSHGHTILHQPQNGFTLQIGNLPSISKIIGQKVVCDFRVQDVQLGGQGAPLVPIGDRILFSEFDFCLNLGGFSNISFENNNNRIAFDISPVNTVLNFYANKLGFAYDNKGEIAKKGTINQQLLEKLNSLEYYQKSFPKSLGFEFVKETVLPCIENFSISEEDKMRTFVAHIAIQIAKALPKPSGKILITGGGAYNDFLIENIKNQLVNHVVIVPDSKTIEFKEALIFGLLGVLKLRNEVNVLQSVTGAEKDHSSGIIFEAI